jgi:hypothetical protein
MSLSVTIPARTDDGTPVNVGSWYPEIAPGDVRKAMRLGDTVTADRLRAALIAAIVTVGNDLATWKAAQQSKSELSLADLPAEEIDGESVLVHAWRRAVMSYAAADLCETHAEISATNDGLQRATEVGLPVDQHRRNALHAIRDILGKRRSKIALI